MSVALELLAQLVDGRLVGDGRIEITGAATLHDAGCGEITFIDHPRLVQRLAQSPAAAAVVPSTLQPEGIPFIEVNDVRQAFARIVTHFRPPRQTAKMGVSCAAHVSASARLAGDVDVYPAPSWATMWRSGPGASFTRLPASWRAAGWPRT